MSHKYDSFCDIKKFGSKLRMWVIAMTQLYYALRLDIWNLNGWNFCVGGGWNFKNFHIIQIQIKFSFEWYVCYWYFGSRTRDIADVLKIEHCT